MKENVKLPKFKSLICLSLLAVGCAAPMWADGFVRAGDAPWHGRGGDFRAVLLDACEAYYQSCYSLTVMDMDDEVKAHWMELRDKRRREVLALLESHPEQINDILYDHGAVELSPLYCAVKSGDAEMVRLMLDKGAVPFLVQTCGRRPDAGMDMLLEPGGYFGSTEERGRCIASPEIRKMILEARSKYDVPALLLMAHHMGLPIDNPHARFAVVGRADTVLPEAYRQNFADSRIGDILKRKGDSPVVLLKLEGQASYYNNKDGELLLQRTGTIAYASPELEYPEDTVVLYHDQTGAMSRIRTYTLPEADTESPTTWVLVFGDPQKEAKLQPVHGNPHVRSFEHDIRTVIEGEYLARYSGQLPAHWEAARRVMLGK